MRLKRAKMRMTTCLSAVLLLMGAAIPARAADEARLLRFPAIHGDTIAFCYAGNLYVVSAKGGLARRLTTSEGYEMFPRFSPDGKQIAFTGQYDGNTEVYLIPAEGGEPKRLTFTPTLGRDEVSDRMGPNNIVIGWHPDGKHVLVRSRMHSFNPFLGGLYLVPVEGGLPEPLPLPRGGFASYSPDGKQLVFNRVFREFRTWKRYRGGMADDVWLYDFASKKTTNLTNTPAQEIIPMWTGGRVYFLSDRGEKKRMNLYSLDPANPKQVTQHTHFTDFDVKFPSADDQAIVFEEGGWIYRFDLGTQKAERVHVRIADDQPGARPTLKNVSGQITTYEISPDGKRALFGARGDVFTVPAKDGPTRNLTQTAGTHERNPKWSPDGKRIAFVSDASGEDEICVVPQEDGGKPQQLTTGGNVYKYDLAWSPDSKKIAWTDRKQRLLYLDVDTKKVTPVAHADAFEIRTYAWSPDSAWLAYVKPEVEAQSRIYLYSLATGKSFPITDPLYDAEQPAFSPDGKYLYFVSGRTFNPTFGQTEYNHVYLDMNRIYLVALAKDAPNPFPPKDDEVGGSKPAAKPAAKPAEKKKEGVTVKVDPEGIQDRVVALAVPPGNYRQLEAVGTSLYYMRGNRRDPRPTLAMFDLNSRKETTLGQIGGFEISADGKKMLFNQNGKYAIIDLPHAPVQIGTPLNLSDMEMMVDHRAEWAQMFRECWRQMRDFFYDPHMNGVDWLAMRQKYEPLVPYVRHRADLTYIIGEMIAELNIGHAYVGGGELPAVRKIPMGSLGAELVRDPKSGFFRITKILRGANWDRTLRSPLTELGLNVKEGDYIIAVNGKPTSSVKNIYELLVNTANKPVKLTINGEPSPGGARTVQVTPIADDSELYYHEWVTDNRRKVAVATGGRVGYLHIPDMQTEGLNEFAKAYYGQLNKKALIIDVRGNGGGNVSAQIIERLRRKLAMVDIARNTAPSADPGGTFVGPMVCLMNEFSASDGDIFPYRFRYYHLGPLVGKRSWGGVVGIRGTLPLLDGGTLNRPEFSRYGVDGKEWIIEGHGVDPDIVVDNDPAQEQAGNDQQLNRAIAEALKLLKTKEKDLPPPPPYPKR